MSRWSLLMLLLVAACSKGPEADLQAVSEARSVAAEWALVNEQANKGHLTSVYVQMMHQSVHRELRSSLDSLSEPGAPYAHEIEALLREPDDSSPSVLRVHADNLRRIEERLESA